MVFFFGKTSKTVPKLHLSIWAMTILILKFGLKHIYQYDETKLFELLL